MSKRKLLRVFFYFGSSGLLQFDYFYLLVIPFLRAVDNLGIQIIFALVLCFVPLSGLPLLWGLEELKR